jgi:cytochrome c
VQAVLPNRNGKTTDHAMWPGATMGSRTPDTRSVACMSNCASEPRLASFLPECAPNAHATRAQPTGRCGPPLGADTTRPPGAATRPTLVAAAAPSGTGAATGAFALAQKHNCLVCHGADTKIVGPGFREVAGKHAGRGDAVEYLMGRIKAGGVGVWGNIPMPAQTIPEADAKAIAQWLADGARR